MIQDAARIHGVCVCDSVIVSRNNSPTAPSSQTELESKQK